MEEIRERLSWYKEVDQDKLLATREGLSSFAARFYGDAAEIYDVITRIRNTERNPTGFCINEAPILGLLVRVWKILKEIVKYYEQDNADIICMLDRPAIEAAIVAKYLLISGDEIVEDYRKCSYKDRLRSLNDANEGKPFFPHWQDGGSSLPSSKRCSLRAWTLIHSKIRRKTNGNCKERASTIFFEK